MSLLNTTLGEEEEELSYSSRLINCLSDTLLVILSVERECLREEHSNFLGLSINALQRTGFKVKNKTTAISWEGLRLKAAP